MAADRSNIAVLVPVKSFTTAKIRLAPALDPAERASLARSMAANVVTAAHPLPVSVVCDDEIVAEWAARAGAAVVWCPGLGLNGAVSHGVAALAEAGATAVIVAHADLPLADDLARVAGDEPEGRVTLVPDRRDDGTNVLCIPAASGFAFAYGPRSFERHRVEAGRLGLTCRVLRDARLGWDVDVPDDLAYRVAVRLNLDVPGRALAIAAHPDDVEFGCGGTLAKWAAQGCVINHLVCTDGSKGSWDPAEDTAALVVVRQAEQRSAAAALGSTGDVIFLGWPDGELDGGLRQRWEVAYWIRRLQPDVVFGHDPWRRYRLHPDHRNAGFLACDGIVAARDPHFFPEQQLPHHRPSTLLLWEADEPDHLEDVSGHVDAKLAALYEHRSQLRSTMHIEPDDDGTQRAAFERRLRDRLASIGRRAGVAYAEAFKRIDDL